MRRPFGLREFSACLGLEILCPMSSHPWLRPRDLCVCDLSFCVQKRLLWAFTTGPVFISVVGCTQCLPVSAQKKMPAYMTNKLFLAAQIVGVRPTSEIQAFGQKVSAAFEHAMVRIT